MIHSSRFALYMLLFCRVLKNDGCNQFPLTDILSQDYIFARAKSLYALGGVLAAEDGGLSKIF